MGREVIQCEYCHTLITEKDVVCPKCGANCSEVIKNYKEEQNKKIEENEKFVKDIFKKNTSVVRTIGIIIFVIAIASFIFIFYSMMQHTRKRDNTINNMNNTKIVEEVKEVNATFNEEAETDDMKVILDSYELYEYHSDHFQSLNTVEGYQKIAFHFNITNKKSTDISTTMIISLTADGTAVEESELEMRQGFEDLVTGSEKYDSINNSIIRANDSLNGYVGYLVPTNKKTLKFRIGKSINITMDNPAYQG